MRELPPDLRADLVFIGAGPKTTGILLALAATSDAGAGRTVHLIDPYPPGAGRIWRTAQSPHLWMNSRTEDITIFPDSSCTLERTPVAGPSLHEWIHDQGLECLAAAGLGEDAESLDSQSFASRRVQGHYLEWAFDVAMENLAATVHIHRARAEVVDRIPVSSRSRRLGDPDHDLRDTGFRDHDLQGTGFRVVTSEGVSILTDTVVSAQGHLDMSPADADLEFERVTEGTGASSKGLYYQRPGYTADIDFGGIPAGADVLARGFGLAFIDLMVILTLGRGGEFIECGGRLRYLSSGKEPVLWVGSSRGVPYSPKLGYSRADLPGAPGVELRYLNTDRLEQRPVATGAPTGAAQAEGSQIGGPHRDGTIDFRAVIGPLAELELTYAHYEHVLWKRGISDAALLSEIDDVAQQVLDADVNSDLATAAQPDAASSDDVLGSGRASITASAASVLDDPADLFDLDAIDRPLDDATSHSLGEGEALVLEHIEAQLARSADLHHSADLAVFEALVKSYVAIRMLVRAGRVSAKDRALYVEGSFHSLFSFIGSGPPPLRIRQIIALHEAGLLRFLGPGLNVEASEAGFRATSSAHPDATTFTYFVEARLAKQSAARAFDPALESLGERGAILLESGRGEAASHTKLRTDSHGHALDKSGRSQPDLFLLGPAVSGSTAEGFSRPRTDAPVFRDNERIASAILESLPGSEVGFGAEARAEAEGSERSLLAG
ncbi:FAD/NAD(P)-binding protein [Brevibacterium sp. RIT 803]|uniref:FAD/NAD(P)-binding protein n=1 Tax=Brevibacterium sp. RIT 803 TaxID=2810210 RepID=UPI00194EA7A6|nr:FAD/NAD(P)-binding protein [Brevibacterium sp. RIT 803]MBM6589623.1 FAD/NAD(P)-binding protein [Brevibacterium sp. RIT 803]